MEEVVDVHVPQRTEEILHVPTQHVVEAQAPLVQERTIRVPRIATQVRTHRFHDVQTDDGHIPHEHEEMCRDLLVNDGHIPHEHEEMCSFL